jgi:hypothetical protein
MSASLTCIQNILNQLHEWACGAELFESEVTDSPSDLCPSIPALSLSLILTCVQSEDQKPVSPQRIKIGLVTFNETIQYYWVRPNAPHPISMTLLLSLSFISLPPPPPRLGLYTIDPEDPFPPLPASHWLLDLSTQKSSLDLLLDSLPDILQVDNYLMMYPQSPNMTTTVKSTGKYATSTGLGVMPVDPSRQIFSQACPTAVLKCLQVALEKIGGRVMLLSDSNPDRGLSLSLPLSPSVSPSVSLSLSLSLSLPRSLSLSLSLSL